MMATEAKTLKINEWTSPEFWRRLEIKPEFGESLRGLMRTEGYFQLNPPQWGLPLADMAALVAELDKHGIPTPFAFLFDEFWLLFAKLKHLIEAQLGPGFFMLPDFWVWYVDPARDGRGWSPHRDKGYKSLREDGSPKSVTVWIPLSEATTLNGCMYLVPADRDPTYGTENDREWKFAYPDIRALPAQAGTRRCCTGERTATPARSARAFPPPSNSRRATWRRSTSR